MRTNSAGLCLYDEGVSQQPGMTEMFDVDQFEPAPDPDLVCCICQGVLNDPVESPCRHVYCRGCIERWLDNNHNCPTCRDRLYPWHLKPVLPILQNMINRLTRKCKFQSTGCEEKISLERYKTHVNTCDFEVLTCRFSKCAQRMHRKLLKDHETKTCKFREVRCTKHCELMIPIADIDSHDCLSTLKERLEGKEGERSKLREEIEKLMDNQTELMKQIDDLRSQINRRRTRHGSFYSDLSSSENSTFTFSNDTDTDYTDFDVDDSLLDEVDRDPPTTRGNTRSTTEREPDVDLVTVDVDSEISFNLRGHNQRLPSSTSSSEVEVVNNPSSSSVSGTGTDTREGRQSSTYVSQRNNHRRRVTEETVVRRYRPGDPAIQGLNLVSPDREIVGPVVHTRTTRTYRYYDGDSSELNDTAENRGAPETTRTIDPEDNQTGAETSCADAPPMSHSLCDGRSESGTGGAHSSMNTSTDIQMASTSFTSSSESYHARDRNDQTLSLDGSFSNDSRSSSRDSRNRSRDFRSYSRSRSRSRDSRHDRNSRSSSRNSRSRYERFSSSHSFSSSDSPYRSPSATVDQSGNNSNRHARSYSGDSIRSFSRSLSRSISRSPSRHLGTMIKSAKDSRSRSRSPLRSSSESRSKRHHISSSSDSSRSRSRSSSKLMRKGKRLHKKKVKVAGRTSYTRHASSGWTSTSSSNQSSYSGDESPSKGAPSKVTKKDFKGEKVTGGHTYSILPDTSRTGSDQSRCRTSSISSDSNSCSSFPERNDRCSRSRERDIDSSERSLTPEQKDMEGKSTLDRSKTEANCSGSSHLSDMDSTYSDISEDTDNDSSTHNRSNTKTSPSMNGRHSGLDSTDSDSTDHTEALLQSRIESNDESFPPADQNKVCKPGSGTSDSSPSTISTDEASSPLYPSPSHGTRQSRSSTSSTSSMSTDSSSTYLSTDSSSPTHYGGSSLSPIKKYCEDNPKHKERLPDCSTPESSRADCASSYQLVTSPIHQEQTKYSSFVPSPSPSNSQYGDNINTSQEGTTMKNSKKNDKPPIGTTGQNSNVISDGRSGAVCNRRRSLETVSEKGSASESSKVGKRLTKAPAHGSVKQSKHSLKAFPDHIPMVANPSHLKPDTSGKTSKNTAHGESSNCTVRSSAKSPTSQAGTSYPLESGQSTEQKKKRTLVTNETEAVDLKKRKKSFTLPNACSGNLKEASTDHPTVSWDKPGGPQSSNPTVKVKIDLSVNMGRLSSAKPKLEGIRSASRPGSMRSSTSTVASVSTAVEQPRSKAQTGQSARTTSIDSLKRPPSDSVVKTEEQGRTGGRGIITEKPSNASSRHVSNSDLTAHGGGDMRSLSSLHSQSKNPRRDETSSGRRISRPPLGQRAMVMSDSDDSSDNSWSPGSHMDDGDITISEEIESDSSYELVVRKSANELLNELANTNDDSDDTWSPHSFFCPSP